MTITEWETFAEEIQKNRDERLRENLHRRFLKYAQRLKKTDPELATKIEKNIGKLVEWYVVNKRDLTMEDFSRIIGGIELNE